MISIIFIVGSDWRIEGFNTLNRDDISILNLSGVFDETSPGANDIRRYQIPMDSVLANAIVQGVTRSDPSIVNRALNEYDAQLAQFYAVIRLQGVTGAQIKKQAQPSKSGKTVISLFDNKGERHINNKRSYVKPVTLARRYKINSLVNRLPYQNFENNDSGDENCVLHYFKTYHPRLSKKKLKEAFKNGADFGTLIDYVQNNELNTTLVNFNGRVLYKNDCNTKGRKSVYAMIADNHLYPLCKKYSKFKPEYIKHKIDDEKIRDDVLENDMIPEDMIMVNSNSTFYTPDGVCSPYKIDFNEEFMDNMRVNYTHKGDIHSLNCLLLINNKQIENVKYEYDLKSAYTNVATDWSTKEIVGIFSCFDMWKKYRTGCRILDEAHYSISKEALKRIRPFGVSANIMDGYQLNLLINKEYLSENDIEYVKIPTARKSFDDYKDKFITLRNNLVEGLEEGSDEYKKKLDQVRIYIGMLGKYDSTRFSSIIGLGNEDHELLNFECDKEVWKKCEYTFDDENDKTKEITGTTYTKETHTTNTINACHIRNYIVSYTNRIMLRNIIHIYETTKKLPYKIVTDAIGYTDEQELLHEDIDKFKLEVDPKTKPKNKQKLIIKKKELKKYTLKVTRKYHNIKQITIDILENIKNKIKQNKTINGAPGTGKTYVMKQGPKIYDMCGTITNMCKRNMDPEAQTLYSMLLQHSTTRNRLYNIHKRLKFRRIWIDEFSMIPNTFWNILFDACMYHFTTLFLTGDINQIAPIGSNKINLKNPIVKMLFGEVTTLTKDWRNDAGIIKIRDDVLNQKGVPALSTKPFNDCVNHIVLTHTMRRYINLQILKQRGETFEYKDGFINASIGCTIKSRSNLKELDIFKNELYIVKKKGKDTWTLQNKYYKHEVKITKKDMNHFDIGYANTYHSTQGLTFKDRFCLHEVTRAYEWDHSILYTGITRGTSIKNIDMYDTAHECDGCDECTYMLPLNKME